MTEKIFNVTDLGPGDGGKGGVVHKIATMVHRVGKFLRRVHSIIKRGGGQGNHGVSTSRGESFAFSHWGCGTFEGISTHITPQMIIIPEGVLNEAEALRYTHGIYDPFKFLTIDREALCSTPYHGIASRLKEMARANNPRGTIGTGVGEACRYWQKYPELAIKAEDLDKRDIKDRLAAVREQIRSDLAIIIQGEFLPDDKPAVDPEIALLKDDKFLDYNVEKFREFFQKARMVDSDFLRREILSQDGVAVVENSHGVLTDNFYGFYPHTSAIRTLPKFSHDMLRQAGYSGQIINIGVHRAYEIRHGAGPMPTADLKMGESLLPGSHKMENRYQGEVRVGPIDLVLMRYAIEVCGGPTAFDGLAVTWFDQIEKNGAWCVCNRYFQETIDPTFFVAQERVRVGREENERHFHNQEALTKSLFNCEAEITVHLIPRNIGRDHLYSFCAEIMKEGVGVPVRMVSFGPTELDKVCK